MKFVIASGIYWELSVQNFVQIHSDLTFLLYNVSWLLFLRHSVV